MNRLAMHSVFPTGCVPHTSYYTALLVLMAPLALRTYPVGVCNCNCNCNRKTEGLLDSVSSLPFWLVSPVFLVG